MNGVQREHRLKLQRNCDFWEGLARIYFVDWFHRSLEMPWLESKALLCQGFGERKWSWRESNPRPNKEQTCFLHAYPVIDCRQWQGKRHPKPKRIPFISSAGQDLLSTSLKLTCAPWSDRNQASPSAERLVPGLAGDWALSTKLRLGCECEFSFAN